MCFSASVERRYGVSRIILWGRSECALPLAQLRCSRTLKGTEVIDVTDEEVDALVRIPPSAILLGRRLLEHDEARGWIKFGFEGKPEFLNPAGRVQGGILTAMLDDTMGPAVLLKSGGALYPSSIDMNVSFLAAAKAGPLVCEGEVVRLGKTVGFVEGRLMDSDGRLIARATSSVMLVPAERVN